MRQPYNNYLLIFCIATISPMHKGLFSVWSYNTLEKPSMHGGGGVVIVSLYKSKLLLSGHISFVFHLLCVVPYIYHLSVIQHSVKALYAMGLNICYMICKKYNYNRIIYSLSSLHFVLVLIYVIYINHRQHFSRIYKAACYYVLYFTRYNNNCCICFIFLPLCIVPYIYHALQVSVSQPTILFFTFLVMINDSFIFSNSLNFQIQNSTPREVQGSRCQGILFTFFKCISVRLPMLKENFSRLWLVE